ncbi:MAG: hypothetical protein H6664_07020 [Ardenticatenaceae bacterium]|nr:hypothetical protein [Ardenticatenaceae bacterium]MCB9004109.1 hypothetical protein [Ardenticatenaceae bacterium]
MQFEQPVDGSIIDIVRGDLLIEIQTGNFSAIKAKLAKLLPAHPIRLVYPIAQEKWIVRETAVGQPISRRKSPKRGQLHDVFAELVRIPHLLPHPNLTLELLLTQQEEIWRDDGKGSWRRKGWSIHDRRLLQVLHSATFTTPADLLTLLPTNLPSPFTNRELATAMHGRMRLAQQITYTLRQCHLLTITGKQGNAHMFQFTG